MPDHSATGGPAPEACHRHPENRAGVRCQRCDRRICALCMHTASVGFHCPDCVSGAARRRTPGVRHGGLSPRRVLSLGRVEGPAATMVLAAINVAAFVVGVAGGGGGRLYDRFASGGGRVMVDHGLLGIGRSGRDFIGVAEGEWSRLLTGGFLHLGLLHLLVNVALLWMLGRQLEQLHGTTRFTGLYLASLLAGSLGVMLRDPLVLTVGASGAVYGLMGAAAVHQLRHRGGAGLWGSGLGGLLLVNVLFTFGRPGISISGHLGGLAGGALIAWLAEVVEARRAPRAVGTALPYVLGLAFAVGAVWASGRWWDPVLG
ncbi:MAG: rhomboid family intramembrane serine protease [Actinomycetota bacterium]|nr:rhomboid family intramembrane serine protease [Actinomycetota bacterium]MEE2957471.1 rhomboid family intramembrane serine protease [Actinomycetota bacterium]